MAEYKKDSKILEADGFGNSVASESSESAEKEVKVGRLLGKTRLSATYATLPRKS